MKPTFVLLLWALLATTVACGQSRGPQAAVLAPAAYQSAISTAPDLQLVDVRTAPEYAQGHLAQAVNIDLRQPDFLAQMQAQLDKSQPVYVYCRSGRRSAAAASMLRDAGFTQVYDLQGGILNWTSANLPVTKP